MLYLIVEDEYKSFPWFQRTLRSLYGESRKKRVAFQEINSVSEISAEDHEAGVLLLGATETWSQNQVRQILERGAYPISMVNRGYSILDEQLSSISMDLRGSMRLAVEYLRSLGCEKLALYGVNPHSSSDPTRAKMFGILTGDDEHIYYNDKRLSDTFEKFREHLDEYDAVICVNDYAAVSLLHRLLEIGVDPTQRPYIVSHGNMILTRMTRPSITSISDDYEYFGRAAMFIYNSVIREKQISSIHIQLRNHLHVRETTGNRPWQPEQAYLVAPETVEPNPFYSDSEVADMAKMEWLLNLSDDTDLTIIRSLMECTSYSDIAERCFISETAAKYRVKKMESVCDVSNRAELVKFFRRFI